MNICVIFSQDSPPLSRNMDLYFKETFGLNFTTCLIDGKFCFRNYSFAYRTGETSLPTVLPDRVVNIRGTVEEMCAAEASVSAILRECYDKEMQAPMVPISI